MCPNLLELTNHAAASVKNQRDLHEIPISRDCGGRYAFCNYISIEGGLCCCNQMQDALRSPALFKWLFFCMMCRKNLLLWCMVWEGEEPPHTSPRAVYWFLRLCVSLHVFVSQGLGAWERERKRGRVHVTVFIGSVGSIPSFDTPLCYAFKHAVKMLPWQDEFISHRFTSLTGSEELVVRFLPTCVLTRPVQAFFFSNELPLKIGLSVQCWLVCFVNVSARCITCLGLVGHRLQRPHDFLGYIELTTRHKTLPGPLHQGRVGVLEANAIQQGLAVCIEPPLSLSTPWSEVEWRNGDLHSGIASWMTHQTTNFIPGSARY